MHTFTNTNPDFFASHSDHTQYMDDSSFSDPTPVPAFLNEGVWHQLRGGREADASWQIVLVDRGGYLVERDQVSPPAPPATPPRRAAPLQDPQALDIFTGALQTGHVPLLIEPGEDGERLWAVAPLQLQGAVPGALLVGGAPRNDRPLEEQAAPLLDAGRLFAQFAASIGNLYARTDSGDESLQARFAAQMERSAALQQISALVIATREVDVISRTVLLETRRLFRADRAGLFLRQPDNSLRCSASLGLSTEYTEAAKRLYAQSAAGRAFATLDIVYVADAQNDGVMGPMREMAQAEGYRAIIVVPFVNEGEAIGALTLYHDQPREYSPDDTVALTTFANQVGIAIDNARLFEDSQRQLARLTFLTEAGRLLNSTLEMEQIFTIIAQAAARLIGGGCGLYLPQADDTTLDLRIYYDQAISEQARRQAYLEAHLPVAGQGPIGEMVISRTARLVAQETEILLDPYLLPLGSHAYLAVPLRAQDRVTGVLVLWLFNRARRFSADDIALAEALADRATVVLENARLYERERQAQRAKDEFLSSVSHELRTPLTAILGYAQLLHKRFAKDPDQAQAAQQLQTIRSQADRLHRLIETILDISRIEKGQLELQAEQLDLGRLLQTVVERTQAASRSTLHFDVQLAANPCPVWGDKVRLEQVFSHLLSNAAKYSPADGTIRVYLIQVGDQLHIDISDQGQGIGAGEAHRLFERYYKADTPLNRAGGLGLGLYVSRAIVEAHGGTIGVQTAPGAGALFRVTLRCVITTPPAGDQRMTRARLLDTLQIERARWDDLRARLPEARLIQPGVEGQWSVKDLVAHITWFEREMVTLLRSRSLTSASDLWRLPADERNAAIFAANQDRPLREVLDEARTVFSQLLPLVAALDDADLTDPDRYAEMPGDWVPWKLLAENTYEHYQAHGTVLRAWLEQ